MNIASRVYTANFFNVQYNGWTAGFKSLLGQKFSYSPPYTVFILGPSSAEKATGGGGGYS